MIVDAKKDKKYVARPLFKKVKSVILLVSEGYWHGTGTSQGFGKLQDEAFGYLGWIIGKESKGHWTDAIVTWMVATKEDNGYL